MDTPVLIGRSVCIACTTEFTFDVDRVPVITLKIEGAAGARTVRYDPDGAQFPICPTCAKRINPQRIANGLPPMYEGDTAADLQAGRPHGLPRN